ncbi:MAG: amidase domain-containing protein [Christensenellales bacterium]
MGYDREAAAEYARQWAFLRNPRYMDFDPYGGDCTNFASQCIFAGAKIMNFTPTFGWYFIDSGNRTASWTGVQFLYNFLVNNAGVGPYGKLVSKNQVEVADIVQLGDASGRFYHSPVIVRIAGGEIYVAAHTRDVYDYPLSLYRSAMTRFIKIEGVRERRR